MKTYQEYQDDPYITETIRKAVNELLDRNGYTQGAVVGELHLGRRGLWVKFRHPKVIDGTCTDVSRTEDLFDLIDEHKRNQ